MPDKPQWGAVYAQVRSFGESHSWWLVALFTAGVTLTTYIIKNTGRPATWDLIHDLLDLLHEQSFGGPDYANQDEHKVTLFKAVPKCKKDRFFARWWHGVRGKYRYLVPVARSGHTNQETEICFEIGDNGRLCRGVAGRAWVTQKKISVSGLPNMLDSPYKHQMELYASSTNVTLDRVKQKPSRARAILAIPVKVKGSPWGVLVWDSENPAQIDRPEVDDLFRVISKHLSDLIEKNL